MQKVAVITRTKNRPLLLQRCVLSVLNQTYQDWFHVIVNDGGDPTTLEGVVARFGERYRGRVKIIHNQTSVGMQNASNLGIRATDSEYVGIHDDDDTWHGMFLEECVGYLEAAGPDSREQGVAVQSFWIMEEMDSWGDIVEISRQDYLPFETVNLFQTAAKNPFPPISFLYRRRVHEKIGYFDQEFNELGDHDFNLRFLSHYDIGTIHKRLAGYHWRHQANGSSYGNTVTDGVTSHRKMFVRMQNHYLRQDMAEQRVGIGFLMNMSSTMESQMEWIHGLHTKSDQAATNMSKVLRKMQYYERILDTVLTPWKGRTLPRRVYDHVTDWLTPAFKDNGVSKNGHAMPTQLETELQSARVISLDVFDTALLRLVRKPTDVFLFIQSDVRRLLKRPELGFVETRVTAEEEARQEKLRAGGGSEITLDEIYAVLRNRLECDEATVNQIKQWELEAEQKLCYANPHIAQLAARIGNGSKVVFASDMYLPSKEITALLERNGFKNLPLFLSADLRKSKHEGGLYDHVMATLQCQPREMLHIGDNAQSDVERPRAKGISSHHWTRPHSQMPLVDQHTSISGAWEGDLASSLYTGLVRRRRLSRSLEKAEGRAFWEMIGYEVMGPLHHAYVSWVIQHAGKMGLKKLFFLARDGFNLIKVFEMFREQNRVTMETEYLFASRRLWNFARVDRLDEENLTFLTMPNPMMRVRDFLGRIDIDPGPHEALARRLGFQSLDERITAKAGGFKSDAHRENTKLLIGEFEGQIIEHARREREVLVKYFKDVGLLEEQVGIVDVGWGASSSRSLQMLLAQSGQHRRIPAFYFGTWNHAQWIVEAGCQFESMFMHLSQPLYRSWLILESVELIELFFSAPHPTITSIENKDGKWRASYGEPEMEATTEEALKIATDAAFEFVKDALAIWPANQEISPPFGYLETVLERLLRHPTRDEAVAFGEFSWRNTYGGTGPLRHLANVPTYWERLSRHDALQDAYDHCYWKKGFLAQLSARARGYVNV